MFELKILFESLDQTSPITLLNSGNVISTLTNCHRPRTRCALGKVWLSYPCIISKLGANQLIEKDPFEGVEVSKSIRLYINFVWAEGRDLEAVDSEILDSESPSEIFTVVDLEDTSTFEALQDIEKRFKKKSQLATGTQ